MTPMCIPKIVKKEQKQTKNHLKKVITTFNVV